MRKVVLPLRSLRRDTMTQALIDTNIMISLVVLPSGFSSLPDT